MKSKLKMYTKTFEMIKINSIIVTIQKALHMSTITKINMKIEKLKIKIEKLKIEIEYLEWMLDNEDFDCDTVQYILINLKKLDIDKIIEEIETNETANEDDTANDSNDNSSDTSSDVSDEDLSDERQKKRLNELRDDINETEKKIHNVCSSGISRYRRNSNDENDKVVEKLYKIT